MRAVYINALQRTISQLNEWSTEAGITDTSFYNFAFSDGTTLIATRYVNDSSSKPATLYYAQGEQFICSDGICNMITSGNKTRALMVASEPITKATEGWKEVPINCLLTSSEELGLAVSQIELD